MDGEKEREGEREKRERRREERERRNQKIRAMEGSRDKNVQQNKLISNTV